LRTVQGNVLIIQKDESDSNLQQKSNVMDATDPEHRIRVEFHMNYRDLEKWIVEHQARYVFLDSFGSLFGADGADLSDMEAGIHLYRLNEIAAKHGAAVLLTHHLRKKPGHVAKRTDVTLSDFFGSTYVAAGTSDAWAYYADPEAAQGDHAYLLKNVKPRSGMAQLGDTYRIQGSSEDYSLQVMGMVGSTDGVSGLRDGAVRIITALKERSEQNPIRIEAVDQNDENDLVRAAGVSRPTASRLLNQLFSEGKWGIKRKLIPTPGKGRPAFAYWID
jgi:hypothetical protein